MMLKTSSLWTEALYTELFILVNQAYTIDKNQSEN